MRFRDYQSYYSATFLKNLARWCRARVGANEVEVNIDYYDYHDQGNGGQYCPQLHQIIVLVGHPDTEVYPEPTLYFGAYLAAPTDVLDFLVNATAHEIYHARQFSEAHPGTKWLLRQEPKPADTNYVLEPPAVLAGNMAQWQFQGCRKRLVDEWSGFEEFGEVMAERPVGPTGLSLDEAIRQLILGVPCGGLVI